MLGDEHRLDPFDQRFEAGEMTAIELLGAPQGQGDAVKAHRIIAPQLEEPILRRRLMHIILGVHLKEADLRPRGRDLRHMRRAQAYTHAAPQDLLSLGHDRGPTRSFWLGPLEAGAGDLRAPPPQCQSTFRPRTAALAPALRWREAAMRRPRRK